MWDRVRAHDILRKSRQKTQQNNKHVIKPINKCAGRVFALKPGDLWRPRRVVGAGTTAGEWKLRGRVVGFIYFFFMIIFFTFFFKKYLTFFCLSEGLKIKLTNVHLAGTEKGSLK